MKEEVVIEYLDPIDTTKVAVSSYNSGEAGSILEVCSRNEASEKYDIIGELRNGEIHEYDNEDYDEDGYYDDDVYEED